MASDKAVAYIKEYFPRHLSTYQLAEEYNIPSGYWGVRFRKNKDKILISSERGVLDLKLTMDSQSINAENVIPEMKQVEVSRHENIAFVLDRIFELYGN